MKISRKSWFYRIAYFTSPEMQKPNQSNICTDVKLFLFNATIMPMFFLVATVIVAVVDLFVYIATGKSLFFYPLYQKLRYKEKFREPRAVYVPYSQFKGWSIPGMIFAVCAVASLLRQFAIWESRYPIHIQYWTVAAVVLGSYGGFHFLIKIVREERDTIRGTFYALILGLKSLKEKTCFKIEYTD